MRKISLVVAMSDNRVIGQDNRLAWHLPNDLKHFKALTVGKPIVMGRKTYESIGRPLPNRRNIILSSQRDLVVEGCEVMHSVDEIFDKTQEAPELMITGGGEIYRLFLPFVSNMYITYVHVVLSGEVTFPVVNSSDWKEISREDHQKDEKHAYDYSFVTFERQLQFKFYSRRVVMLLIQAIGFLVDKIDMELATLMQVNKSEVELTLASSFKGNFIGNDSHSSSSFSSSSFSSSSSSSRSSSSSSSSSPSNASSASSFSSSFSSDLYSGGGQGSILKQFTLAYRKEQSVQMDDIRLRCLNVCGTGTITWKELMHSNVSDFKCYLQNSLKAESFTNKKRMILTRFKRGLANLSEMAVEILEKQEGVEKNLDINIDDSIVKNAEKIMGEANDLITYSKEIDDSAAGSGNTEAILFASIYLLKNAAQFCQEADTKRAKAKGQNGSMVDVLPRDMKQGETITRINQEIAQYVFQNLYNRGLFEGYKNGCYWKSPGWTYLFNPQIAKAKCDIILDHLIRFDLAVSNKNPEHEEYWEGLREAIRLLSQAVSAVVPPCSLREQSFDELSENLLKFVNTKANSFAPRRVGNSEI